jgi:hypothetical protein
VLFKLKLRQLAHENKPAMSWPQGHARGSSVRLQSCSRQPQAYTLRLSRPVTAGATQHPCAAAHAGSSGGDNT